MAGHRRSSPAMTNRPRTWWSTISGNTAGYGARPMRKRGTQTVITDCSTASTATRFAWSRSTRPEVVSRCLRRCRARAAPTQRPATDRAAGVPARLCRPLRDRRSAAVDAAPGLDARLVCEFRRVRRRGSRPMARVTPRPVRSCCARREKMERWKQLSFCCVDTVLPVRPQTRPGEKAPQRLAAPVPPSNALGPFFVELFVVSRRAITSRPARP